MDRTQKALYATFASSIFNTAQHALGSSIATQCSNIEIFSFAMQAITEYSPQLTRFLGLQLHLSSNQQSASDTPIAPLPPQPIEKKSLEHCCRTLDSHYASAGHALQVQEDHLVLPTIDLQTAVMTRYHSNICLQTSKLYCSWKRPCNLMSPTGKPIAYTPSTSQNALEPRAEPSLHSCTAC